MPELFHGVMWVYDSLWGSLAQGTYFCIEAVCGIYFMYVVPESKINLGIDKIQCKELLIVRDLIFTKKWGVPNYLTIF